MASFDMNKQSKYIISSKITGWSVKDIRQSVSAAEEVKKPEVLKDLDPREIKISRRDDGTLESVTRKCTFNTNEGTKKFYITISFININGVLDGKVITIERPMEFFLTPGQNGPEHEWITAMMRTLSLNARTGFIAKSLTDLRQINSSYTLWYGKSKSGKTKIHTSIVAALTWVIQDELFKRGYFTENYEEASLPDMVERFKLVAKCKELMNNKSLTVTEQNDEVVVTSADSETNAKPPSIDVSAQTVGVCPQPGCGGGMVIRDGCPTCLDCSYSKCA